VKGRVSDPSLEGWGDQGLWVPSSLSGAYRPLPSPGRTGGGTGESPGLLDVREPAGGSTLPWTGT
jgi:hypothetical protein